MARATDSGCVRRASMRATTTLLLAAQLLTLGHLLIVRHTICPEHGEAIHSGSPSETPALRPTHEGATGDPALGSGAPLAEHAHDHCLARANPRERFALLPALDLRPGPLLVAATLPSLSAVAVAPAVAVLFLAPKNSPPWA
jgi:hypothetical protein